MNVKSKTLIIFFIIINFILFLFIRHLFAKLFIEWFHIFYKDNWTFQILLFFLNIYVKEWR